MMEEKLEFADNKETRGTKLYYYLKTGVSLLNEFKNLFMLIFAIYFSLKLANIIWLAIMLVISIPILILIGWFFTHRMSKIIEWLSIRHGTHYAIRQFTMQEETLEILKDIKDKLK